jgi:hypothetical protein
VASHPNFIKKQFSVDTVSWTPIVAPIDCMGVMLKNSNIGAGVKTRTDSADPATQDYIPAGFSESVTVSRHGDTVRDAGSGARFLAGDTLIYCQADSGTGPVVATFVR